MIFLALAFKHWLMGALVSNLVELCSVMAELLSIPLLGWVGLGFRLNITIALASLELINLQGNLK